jgi:four helix bundle protein
MTDFKNLVVWQKAHELALRVHRAGSGIRKAHDVSLRSQIIRCAFSIPANIVEGRRQESEKEFARFLKIALNSGVELEYHLIIARDIDAISHAEASAILEQVIEVRRMLHGLLKRLRAASSSARSKSSQHCC